MPSLVIENIQVEVNQKGVLNDLSLTVEPGELHVIMGPNGAGKSSLAQVIMGHPDYELTSGLMKFGQQELNQLQPEERAKLGLALAYQNPPAVPGVKLQTLLRLIGLNQPALQTKVKKLWPQVEDFTEKDLNHELSGGEKKISEILQLLALAPKLTIFDELDAGLDLANWQKMVQVIKTEFIGPDRAVIFISHQPQLVKELKPDQIHVILDGHLICSHQDYQKVLTTIQESDYEQCRHCPDRAD